jgi:hypothetical protein
MSATRCHETLASPQSSGGIYATIRKWDEMNVKTTRPTSGAWCTILRWKQQHDKGDCRCWIPHDLRCRTMAFVREKWMNHNPSTNSDPWSSDLPDYLLPTFRMPCIPVSVDSWSQHIVVWDSSDPSVLATASRQTSSRESNIAVPRPGLQIRGGAVPYPADCDERGCTNSKTRWARLSWSDLHLKERCSWCWAHTNKQKKCFFLFFDMPTGTGFGFYG